jgi:hypothetical protein
MAYVLTFGCLLTPSDVDRLVRGIFHPRTWGDCPAVVHGLVAVQTGYSLNPEYLPSTTSSAILVHTIRKKVPTPYCGNHAGPCRVDPLFSARKRKSRALEGPDWILFNEHVNNVLDASKFPGGSAHSTVRGAVFGGGKQLYIRMCGDRRKRWDYAQTSERETAWVGGRGPSALDYEQFYPSAAQGTDVSRCIWHYIDSKED